MAFILLYAFTTEDKSYQFPPPGLTLRWFAVAWERAGHLAPRSASRCGWRSLATALALILGTLAAAALWRARFFGREAVSLLLVLPIALPGIITGIALRSTFGLPTSRSASGPSSSATRPSASSSSTTTSSPASAAPRPP